MGCHYKAIFTIFKYFEKFAFKLFLQYLNISRNLHLVPVRTSPRIPFERGHCPLSFPVLLNCFSSFCRRNFKSLFNERDRTDSQRNPWNFNLINNAKDIRISPLFKNICASHICKNLEHGYEIQTWPDDKAFMGTVGNRTLRFFNRVLFPLVLKLSCNKKLECVPFSPQFLYWFTCCSVRRCPWNLKN